MKKQPIAESSGLEETWTLLRRGRTRRVGWGTGACFQSPGWPELKLDYLVDNRRSKWGTKVNGLTVRSPEALRDEDPRCTVVVIYSQFFDQIIPQLRAVGSFHYATIYALHYYQHSIKALEAMAAQTRGVGTASRDQDARTHAFVMQGPVFADYTATIARCLRLLNPGVPLILSTWDDTKPEVLEAVRKHTDHLIVGPHPDDAGPQNRNRQIISTRRGLELAASLGAKTVMKVRTDAAPLAPRIIEACEAASRLYGAAAARRRGLRGRIFVPETFTRKYLMYHPSDLIMWGALRDLQQFWAAPFDVRSFSNDTPEWKRKSIAQVARDRLSSEGHLGASFAESVGWRLKYTLEDSFEYLRDLYAVQDNNWFRLFWAKWPVLPPVHTGSPLHACLSHYTWQQFVWGTGSLTDEARQLDVANRYWGEFYRPRYRPRRRDTGRTAAA